jgi:hemolysin D
MPGFSSQGDRGNILLKLRSDEQYLVADVLIPKEDLDFLQEGMPAEITVNSPQFQGVGKLPGQVLSIGSDALPPDAMHQYAGIPVKIALDRKALTKNGQKNLLREGISATVTIPIHTKQTIAKTILQKLWPGND